MKFRKKPIVVEAEQFLKGKPLPRGVQIESGTYASVITIHEQRAYLQYGDWVIAEPDGVHFHLCKPDIFKATYEPVLKTEGQCQTCGGEKRLPNPAYGKTSGRDFTKEYIPCPRCQPSDDEVFVKGIRLKLEHLADCGYKVDGYWAYRYAEPQRATQIFEDIREALTRLSQRAKQIEQFKEGAFVACEEAQARDDQIKRLEGEKKGLQEKLRKLCELSCLEDITKESGRDFVCSMRINEVAFVEAKEPLKVIDYVFNSMKKQFYKKVKALKKGE